MQVGRENSPGSPHERRAAVDKLLRIEFQIAVVIAAEAGRAVHPTLGAIGKILAPLAGLRVVQEKGRALPMVASSTGLDLLEHCFTIPDRASDLAAFHV